MKIESQKLNITEAFKNYYYVVPDYQREYVWEEKNVSQLFNDIYDEYLNDRNSEYFIGSIVVNKREDGTYEVIDGQQRLTTLFLSLCALRKIYKGKGGADDVSLLENLLTSPFKNIKGEITKNIHLALQYEDSSDILNKILEEKELPNKLAGSSEKIQDAYENIIDYFNTNFKDDQELRNFDGYFVNKVNFVQIETPSVSDALKIFETINERGVGLNPMDLLKNLIFRQLERKQFSEVNSEWKKITKLLDKNKQKPLRFLRYFIMANYQVRGTKDVEVAREDEIYDWIIRNEKACNYTKNPFGFVNKLYGNADAYINFLNGNNLDGSQNFYLKNIRSLGGGAFSQHLVLLLAAKDLTPELFTHLASQIETLIFYYFITKTPAKTLEAKFSRWADELRELTADSEKQKERLNQFIQEAFVEEIKQMERDFKLLFSNLNINSLQGYKIKYLIAKIAQYVDYQRLGQSETGTLDVYLKKENQIEHILPDTPSDELLATFESPEKYNEYKRKLGNLTLFERPINIVAGRKFFADKKEFYKTSQFYLTKSLVQKDEVGVNNSITRINKKLLTFENWDDKSIDERQEMLFRLAKEIWKIEAVL